MQLQDMPDLDDEPHVGRSSLRDKAELERRRIDRALHIRRPFEAIYTRNENWYLGRCDAYGEDADRLGIPQIDLLSEIMSGPGEYRVIVNRLMAIIAAHVAELTYRDPYARFKQLLPAPQQTYDRAKVVEYLTNFVAKSEPQELHDVLESFLLNGYLGFGTLEVVYLPEERNVDPDEYKAYGEVEVDDDGAFDVVGGQPKADQERRRLLGQGDKIELETMQLGDLFQVRNRHWKDILFDPEGDESRRSHNWVADRFVIRLDDFLDDKRYRHKKGVEQAAKHLDDLYRMDESTFSTILYRRQSLAHMAREGRAPDDMDALRLFGWRIFDYRERRTKILLDDHDLLVYDQRTPHWIVKGRDPYSFLMFHKRPGEAYPLTWVENWIPTGDLYNQLLGLRLRHSKRAVRKLQILKQGLDDEEFEKLKSGQDLEVVQYNDPSAKLEAVPDTPLDPAIFNDINIAIRDGNEIAASSSEQRADPKSKTATSAAIVEGHTALKRERNKAKYARAVGLAYTKLARNLQTNLPEAVSFMMTGPDGKEAIVRATKASIQGELQGEIHIFELGAPDVDRVLGRLNQAIALWGPLVWQIPEFTRPYVDLLGMGFPGLAEAIVAKFQELQADTMVLQQLRQGGYRGAGEAGKREQGQGSQGTPEGQARRLGQDGAGAGGGREFGRRARQGA